MDSTLSLPELSFTKLTLPNGLDVIARRQGTLPIVAANLWYHVGSKDEGPARRGFAHLFEHLMFEGSQHFPSDFFKPLQRVGAGVNGSTSTDRTNYFVDLPTAHLELALAMESDRMGYLLPALTEEKLSIQKGVVTNEYRQNYANRPYGQVSALMAEALYPAGHPYSWLTIGVMEDVEAATLADVEGFFRRNYVPSNASLSLVGDIDEERALALAERYFGSIAGGTRPPGPRPTPPRLEGEVTLRTHDRVELERIYETWHTVPQFHADDAPLALLADVLGRGRASRFYRELVETGIAQNVMVHQSGRELAGTFSAVVTLRPGRSREEARRVVLETLAAIARDGVEPEEMQRAKSGRVADFIYALDNVGGFGGVADRLNAYNTYLGDPGRVVSDIARFQAVEESDLACVAASYLANRPRVSLDVLGRQKTITSLIDRAIPPPPAPAVAYRAPVPEVRRLACGVPLWIIPSRDLPIVAATAVVDAGARVQPADRAGLANLTSLMLDEGTRRRTAHQIALEVERTGSHLSTSCGADGAYVSLQSLSDHFEGGLELAVEVLLEPTFPAEEFDRIRGQTVASLRAERDHAEARASRALLRAVFGDGHAYGAPVEGRVEVIERLERDDLVSFHRDHVRPDRAAWVVAGDVDADALQNRLDGLLAGWEGIGPPDPIMLEPTHAGRPRILLLDRPGAPQSVLRAGQVGLGRRDADYLALLLFNQVLGGLFTSRLNERLREERGLTYGIRSHVDARRADGPFWIGASLQADRLGEAITEVRAEIEALLGERPPTESELADARRSLIEGQARHFESPAALVSRFASLILHGLPPDEHRALPDRLGAVTREEVLSAARRRINPATMTYVVVADAGGALPQLERLDWAGVERIDDGGGASL